ncbi:hypothetical protein NSPZN2_60037 [Nitrospira defluvii]|uniref:Uncharacterized protein n=1 Tax=Nitrospira defluvii TaxID=330214 RepID=A0ABM8S6L8_9BACT|nr:hypothetical protein NSPZN2_60037 [Nitrospira defluvii]
MVRHTLHHHSSRKGGRHKFLSHLYHEAFSYVNASSTTDATSVTHISNLYSRTGAT